MSRVVLRRHLQQYVWTLNTRLDRARQALATGTPQEQIDAAGEIAVLELRLDDLQRRQKWLDALPHGAFEGFLTALADIGLDFAMGFDRLILKY